MLPSRRWGRHSGFRQEPNETPMEYGRRLAHQFPQLKTEITLIIEMLHREVYGEYSLSSKQVNKNPAGLENAAQPGKVADAHKIDGDEHQIIQGFRNLGI